MTITQAIILGVIQGITEFLPISSSGHLIFIPQFLGWADQGLAFDAIIHLGTLLAVLLYFRKRIIKLLKSLGGGGNKNDRRLLLFIVLSIFPAVIAGYVFLEILMADVRMVKLIAFNLIFWGIVLGIADYVSKKDGVDIEKMTWGKAVFVACAQALALLPGTSRSGITMTAGLFSKLSRSAAAEFSFLMSIPVIAAAGGFKLLGVLRDGDPTVIGSILFVGLVSAAISGFVAIWGLMKIIQKWSFIPFAVYRVVVGLVILLMLV